MQILSDEHAPTLPINLTNKFQLSYSCPFYFFAEFANRKIDFMTALSVIADVSKYVNLGKQLRVASSKIDEIDQYPPEEKKTRIIQAWFDHDPYPTYETLYQALLKPSVDDKRAARRLFTGLSSSMDSSTSVDYVHNESSSIDTTRGMCVSTNTEHVIFISDEHNLSLI